MTDFPQGGIIMRHAVALCTIALAVLLATVGGARAESICDSLPSDVFKGVAVVTAFRYMPDRSLDYSPNYAVTLTRPGEAPFSALPPGYSEPTDNGYGRQMLYHVDCAIDQDTVFTVANLERQDDVTVLIEYVFNGRSIFTHGNTMRPGGIVKFSAAHGLAQR
jgi:hypothetical protein